MCPRFNFVELFITKLEKIFFFFFFLILRASPEVIAVQDGEHLVAEVLLYVHGN